MTELSPTAMEPESKIALTAQGDLVLRLALRDGRAYDVPLPKGKVEPLLRELLRQQRDTNPSVGKTAGATHFALSEIVAFLAARPQVAEVVPKVPAKRTPEELGL